MNIRSCKAKGRRLALLVRDALLSWAPDLTADDIFVTTSSVPGEDIKFSPRAREIYPFSVECKNTERLNVWSAIKQAENHALRSGYTPLVVFSRNRSKEYVVIELEKFLKLTR